MLELVARDNAAHTAHQFKVFEFCNQIKQGKFNYDIGAHMSHQHIVAQLKECEFLNISPE